MLATHTLPLEQSVFFVHAVRHALVPQMYGVHAVVVAALQTPAPSHIWLLFAEPLEQLAALQTVVVS